MQQCQVNSVAEVQRQEWEPEPLAATKRANDAVILSKQLVSGGSTQILTKLRGWDFDVFAMDTDLGERAHTFVILGYSIMEDSGLMESCNLDTVKLCSFLVEVEAGYFRENPYHNGLHGADVAQTVRFEKRKNREKKPAEGLHHASMRQNRAYLQHIIF